MDVIYTPTFFLKNVLDIADSEFQSVSYGLVTYLGKNNGFLKLNVHSKKLLQFFKVLHINFL